MNRIFAGLLFLVGAAFIASPARADSDPYVVQIATVNASGATTTAFSTVTARGHAFKYYSVQVSGKGAAASAWDVRLEGSLDGANYTLIMTHQTADADGTVKVSTSPVIFPALSFRARINSVTLGSATGLNITAVGIDR